jgi:murein DD-endopeptidase MepM/ murein hydrolase activator NlpD
VRRVRPSVLAFAALVAALLIGGSLAARAQAPTTTTAPPTTTTALLSTTTTTTAPKPTTTVAPPPPHLTTTTAAPKPTTTTRPSGPTTTVPAANAADANAPRVVPPQYIPLINSLKRSGPSNTGPLIDALSPLRALGFDATQTAILGFGRFPVAGYANYTDDFWTPRFTPTFHLHQGNDIFAAEGTPVRAPADGVLRQLTEPVGGTDVFVTIPDGTYFFGAHLSAYVAGQKSGDHVKAGEVIGFVGSTGDAAGGASHLHFEIHPKGGTAVDPKSYLDQWIKDAIANAPAVIAQFQANRPRVVIATVMTRDPGDGPADSLGSQTSPPRTQLLWASAVSPSGGAVQLAEAEAAAAARGFGWESLARDEAIRIREYQQADGAARAILAPLTPRALWGVLALNTAEQS